MNILGLGGLLNDPAQELGPNPVLTWTLFGGPGPATIDSPSQLSTLVHLPALGTFLVTLYLTWSPWHYTGQNYGLAVMFLRRSGVEVDARTKRWMASPSVMARAAARPSPSSPSTATNWKATPATMRPRQ